MEGTTPGEGCRDSARTTRLAEARYRTAVREAGFKSPSLIAVGSQSFRGAVKWSPALGGKLRASPRTTTRGRIRTIGRAEQPGGFHPATRVVLQSPFVRAQGVFSSGVRLRRIVAFARLHTHAADALKLHVPRTINCNHAKGLRGGTPLAGTTTERKFRQHCGRTSQSQRRPPPPCVAVSRAQPIVPVDRQMLITLVRPLSSGLDLDPIFFMSCPEQYRGVVW